MQSEESHLSDQDLLLLVDGELSAGEKTRAAAHLNECWSCRTRKQEIEETIGQFVRFHRDGLDPVLAPVAGPRALLKARLAQAASESEQSWHLWPIRITRLQAGAAAALIALILIVGAASRLRPTSVARNVPVSFPEPSLTPGAVAATSREQVCRETEPKNRVVPAALRRRVFEEYGLVSSEPQAYEVDYLITPALGGADDIRNLWPQSYGSAVWNARVKDALEDRLRDMVCEGRIDLTSAQKEISSDWIAAYKKYFHTSLPIAGGGRRDGNTRRSPVWMSRPHGLGAAPGPTTGSRGKVWVNTRSGKYFRPGSKHYGKTKQGQYMTEAEARKRGYTAAQGD